MFVGPVLAVMKNKCLCIISSLSPQDTSVFIKFTQLILGESCTLLHDRMKKTMFSRVIMRVNQKTLRDFNSVDPAVFCGSQVVLAGVRCVVWETRWQPVLPRISRNKRMRRARLSYSVDRVCAIYMRIATAFQCNRISILQLFSLPVSILLVTSLSIM